MQTHTLRSQVDAQGTIRLPLPEQLANQEVNLILVYQPAENLDPVLTPETEDSLIGLSSNSPDLALIKSMLSL